MLHAAEKDIDHLFEGAREGRALPSAGAAFHLSLRGESRCRQVLKMLILKTDLKLKTRHLPARRQLSGL